MNVNSIITYSSIAINLIFLGIFQSWVFLVSFGVAVTWSSLQSLLAAQNESEIVRVQKQIDELRETVKGIAMTNAVRNMNSR